MELRFDNDYQQKLMLQEFSAPTTISTPADVQKWRSAWMGNLSSWHSPYKSLIDVTKLKIEGGDDVRKALELMVRFFEGFFLKKAVAWGKAEGMGHELLPFPVHATVEEGSADVGVRTAKKREPTDFRSNIQLANDFQRHVVELTFADPVKIETKEQVAILKSKMMNNLMQWHSKWSLLVDCTNLEVASEVIPDFDRLLQAMRGFFMKEVIGYGVTKQPRETYPFTVFRARHKAAAELEGEGNFSGDKADCKSKGS